MSNAVIPAEPDAYDIRRGALMGRHSAGLGFLRAAVAARADRPIYGRTPSSGSADRFRQILAGIDPTAPFEWVHPQQFERISQVGVMYTSDPNLAKYVRMRLRTGINAYSVCGVTHTTCSAGAMDLIVSLFREPVAPWDALICTTTSVLETVRRVREAEADYQRWRFGGARGATGPQLPVIPLGIHCDDFAFSRGERRVARQELGIDDDVTVGLFVGRLVFHAKAHPYPVLKAFQMAAERTGRKLMLIFAGWFPGPEAEQSFRSGAETYAPDVLVEFMDGRVPTIRDRAWAAADIFVSPADNIQETFGLTPVEAMATGLPVIVSDYDGYRDTIRQGVDGFRVKTCAPGVGYGNALAAAYEAEQFTYDHYCWGAASVTSVDVAAYTEALITLVQQPDLRLKMGEAGRRRARETYDWGVVYRQYQDLWSELNARRAQAMNDPDLARWISDAPREAPSRLDPFMAFGHYPTMTLTARSKVMRVPEATIDTVTTALAHPLFGSLTVPPDAVESVFAYLAKGEATIGAAARGTGQGVSIAMRATGLLLKLGIVRVES